MKKLVDSTKKKKVDYSYKRVDNEENFKNIDIDAMEESDEDYIPSSEEEDVVLTPRPGRKVLEKDSIHLIVKCVMKSFYQKCSFKFMKSLLI